MKWSPFGTVALKSCSGRRPTRSESTCGQPAASLQKWSRESLYLWETVRLTKSSKYSRSSAHLMKGTGQMHSSLPTSSPPSPSGGWASFAQPTLNRAWGGSTRATPPPLPLCRCLCVVVNAKKSSIICPRRRAQAADSLRFL